MSAVCKTIAIHGDYLGNLMRYGDNPEKTSLLNNGLENLLAYAENPDKTTIYLKPGEKSVLVDGVLCNPATAELDFKIFRDRYRANKGPEVLPEFDMNDRYSGKKKHVKKTPVTAIHLIQSFSDTGIDPRLVHEMGIEMLERLGVQGVCDTHVNKVHCHNHIIINAYLPDGRSKFILDQQKILDIRTLSDQVQREHGLEIEFASPHHQLYQSRRDKTRGTGSREAGPVSPSHSPSTHDRVTGSAPQTKGSVPQHDAVPVSLQYSSVSSRIDFIDTSRYAWDGRRRGNLEMLIRHAIMLLQRAIAFMREDPDAQKAQPQRELKLSFLENALGTIEREGLSSYEDLRAALNDAGIKLNKAKSREKILSAEEGLKNELVLAVGRYEAAKEMYDSVHSWTSRHDLHLNQYPREQVSRNRAKLAPVTPGQKHDLILLLKKNKEWRIDSIEKGFNNLDAFEADRVIIFLSGKCSTKPDILIPASEYWQKYAGVTGSAPQRDNSDPRFVAVPVSPSHTTEGPVPPFSTSVVRRVDIAEIDPVPARDAFLRDISTETPAKQEILVSLRDAIEQLASLGYSPEDVPTLKEKLSRFETEKEAAETDRQNYSKRYRDLLQLKQAVRSAEHEVPVRDSARETGARASGEVPVSPSVTPKHPSHRWDKSPSQSKDERDTEIQEQQAPRH